MAGMNALPRAQLPAFSSVVVSRRCSTNSSSSGPSSSLLQHAARGELPRPELALVAASELLADYFHSRAPLRQTYTNATNNRTMKTEISANANVPKVLSCIATGNRKIVSMSNKMNNIATR